MILCCSTWVMACHGMSWVFLLLEVSASPRSHSAVRMPERILDIGPGDVTETEYIVFVQSREGVCHRDRLIMRFGELEPQDFVLLAEHPVGILQGDLGSGTIQNGAVRTGQLLQTGAAIHRIAHKIGLVEFGDERLRIDPHDFAARDPDAETRWGGELQALGDI